MKPLFFRFKIAGLSLLMSGLLLVGFGIFFLVAIRQVGLARMDDEIRALGEPQVRSVQPVVHWQGFDQSLRFIYGDEPEQRFAVRVLDPAGGVIFASEHWPAALSDVPVPELPSAPPRPSSGPDDRFPPPPEPAYGRPDGPRRPRGDGRHFIRRLDQDVDGRISAAEFDGPPASFTDADHDGDGYITPEEIPPGLPGRGPERWPDPGAHSPRPKRPVFGTHETPDGTWRMGFMGNDDVTLIVAADLAGLLQESSFFRNAFLVVTPVALLLLGLGGWILASRALRPVAVIARTAESITARDLHRRVPAVSADAELQRLVDVMNGMLERLDRSFHQAARFSADAAHELQTPLTVLQGELDNAVQEATAGSEEQQRYGGLLEEVRGLKAIVKKLLLLARADVGRLPLSPDDVDPGRLIRAEIEDVETMAPHLKVEADVPLGFTLRADGDLLGQVIRNMTTNAVKYSPADGTMLFKLERRDGVIAFTLRNTGTAIPGEERERIFDRFYRVDKSRNRTTRGTGLGLSLAREIARAHGGDLVLDPHGGGMVSFTLTLPAPRT